jgi:Flp pilus assembly protein TadG
MWQRKNSPMASSPVAARFRTRRGANGEGGATLVETAISISVVLLLIFGVFDFSLAFYTYHYVSDAAREGSRWAMVRGNKSCTQNSNLSGCDATPDEVATYVKGLGYPGIDSVDYMTVSTTWLSAGTLSGTTGQVWSSCGTTDTCKAPGNQVQVTVSYNFPLNIPFVNQQAFTVSSTSTMVISQ